MSTNVTWNGTTYSIPAAGETNWANLSNFLIALGNNAQTVLSQKWAERVASTSPATVVDSLDCVIIKGTGAAPLTVNLPAGVPGRVFMVVDGDGNAATHNITIVPNGVETINGAANLVINFNRGAVIIGFDNTKKWVALAEYASVSSTGIPSTSITGLDPSKVVATNGSGLMTSAAQITATDANTASAIVQRDGSGNFAAGMITANLTGTASAIADGIVTNAKVATGAGIAVNKLAALTAGAPVRSDGSGFLTTGQTNLGSEVTGTLPIANGGTGQTAKTAAYNALSPTTTKGDVEVNDGTNVVRLPVGANGQVITADSAESTGIKWASPATLTAANGADADTTMTIASAAIQIITPTANRVYTLPTTSVTQGQMYYFINNAASDYTITVKSSNGDTVRTVYASTEATVVALQATPTTSAHWMGATYATSNPVAWTPSFTNLGSTTNVSMKWYRDGSRIVIFGTFKCGTTDAALCTFSLPTGLTANTSMYTDGRNVVGNIFGNDNSSANIYVTGAQGLIVASDPAGVYIGQLKGSVASNNTVVAENGNSLFTNNSTVTVGPLFIEITGWSAFKG